MRNLPLRRTEAEFLVDLLEDCDPTKEGTWRHDMAAEIRHIFGMCSYEEEMAIKNKTTPKKTP